MAITHHQEWILTLILILCAELRDIAPVACIAHAPAIGCTCCQVLSQSLVADIFVAHTGFYTRCINSICTFTRITQYLRRRWRSWYSNHSTTCEIRGFSISLSHNLHLALLYTLIGKPAETHSCLRVTIDSGYHTIGLLFNLQSGHFVHQSLQIRLRSISHSGSLRNHKLRVRRHSIIRCSIHRIRQYNRRIKLFLGCMHTQWQAANQH